MLLLELSKTIVFRAYFSPQGREDKKLHYSPSKNVISNATQWN